VRELRTDNKHQYALIDYKLTTQHGATTGESRCQPRRLDPERRNRLSQHLAEPAPRLHLRLVVAHGKNARRGRT